jgi:hypothetical protein
MAFMMFPFGGCGRMPRLPFESALSEELGVRCIDNSTLGLGPAAACAFTHLFSQKAFWPGVPRRIGAPGAFFLSLSPGQARVRAAMEGTV